MSTIVVIYKNSRIHIALFATKGKGKVKGAQGSVLYLLLTRESATLAQNQKESPNQSTLSSVLTALSSNRGRAQRPALRNVIWPPGLSTTTTTHRHNDSRRRRILYGLHIHITHVCGAGARTAYAWYCAHKRHLSIQTRPPEALSQSQYQRVCGVCVCFFSCVRFTRDLRPHIQNTRYVCSLLYYCTEKITQIYRYVQ